MKFTTALCAMLASAATTHAAQFNVTVGGTGVLKFNPSSVTAQIGDTVVFTFKQKNHTVTQSTLQNPCVRAAGGFDSGFVPVSDSATEFPQAELTVKDDKPIWVFCRQAGHCQQGMVFAVNPGNNMDAFTAAATGNSTGTTDAGAGVVTVTSTVTVATATVTTTVLSGGSTASAFTTSTSAAPTSTPVDHKVVVGGPGGAMTYTPSNITAQVGDTVTFEFHQKNHTVTQSSFAQPCNSLGTGFDSGFMAVADSATDFPTFTVLVNDTKPIWAYCQQINHCGNGMVFSVNAVESGANNFAAFQALAKSQNGTQLARNINGAVSLNSNSVRGAGIVVAVISVLFGSLLF